MDDTLFLAELQKIERKMMAKALRLTQGCSERAQELLQATVVRAYTKKELFMPDSEFHLWMGKIMKNLFLNEQRSERLRDEYRCLYDTTADDWDFALYECDNQLLLNEVFEQLNGLSNDISVPLSMFAEGYTYSEISQALGVPMSIVRNRIRAARLILKQVFVGE